MTDIALETESTPAATEAHVQPPTSDASAPDLPAPDVAATSSDQRSALAGVGAGVGVGVGVGAGVMCAVDDAMDQPEPLPEALSRAADAAARSGHRFDLMRYLRLRRRP